MKSLKLKVTWTVARGSKLAPGIPIGDRVFETVQNGSLNEVLVSIELRSIQILESVHSMQNSVKREREDSLEAAKHQGKL